MAAEAELAALAEQIGRHVDYVEIAGAGHNDVLDEAHTQQVFAALDGNGGGGSRTP